MELYAKVNQVIPEWAKEFDYYFETKEDFEERIDKIITENNKDLSQKSFAFSNDLIDLSYLFQYKEISSTPKSIHAANATKFNFIFNNSNIVTIQEGLFNNCPKASNFAGCFGTCSLLTTVPANLFDACKEIENVNMCFNQSTEITSSIPDLWNTEKFPKVKSHNLYASGCDKASNYSDIPEGWK